MQYVGNHTGAWCKIWKGTTKTLKFILHLTGNGCGEARKGLNVGLFRKNGCLLCVSLCFCGVFLRALIIFPSEVWYDLMPFRCEIQVRALKTWWSPFPEEFFFFFLSAPGVSQAQPIQKASWGVSFKRVMCSDFLSLAFPPWTSEGCARA